MKFWLWCLMRKWFPGRTRSAIIRFRPQLDTVESREAPGSFLIEMGYLMAGPSIPAALADTTQGTTSGQSFQPLWDSWHVNVGFAQNPYSDVGGGATSSSNSGTTGNGTSSAGVWSPIGEDLFRVFAQSEPIPLAPGIPPNSPLPPSGGGGGGGSGATNSPPPVGSQAAGFSQLSTSAPADPDSAPNPSTTTGNTALGMTEAVRGLTDDDFVAGASITLQSGTTLDSLRSFSMTVSSDATITADGGDTTETITTDAMGASTFTSTVYSYQFDAAVDVETDGSWSYTESYLYVFDTTTIGAAGDSGPRRDWGNSGYLFQATGSAAGLDFDLELTRDTHQTASQNEIRSFQGQNLALSWAGRLDQQETRTLSVTRDASSGDVQSTDIGWSEATAAASAQTAYQRAMSGSFSGTINGVFSASRGQDSFRDYAMTVNWDASASQLAYGGSSNERDRQWQYERYDGSASYPVGSSATTNATEWRFGTGTARQSGGTIIDRDRTQSWDLDASGSWGFATASGTGSSVVATHWNYAAAGEYGRRMSGSNGEGSVDGTWSESGHQDQSSHTTETWERPNAGAWQSSAVMNGNQAGVWANSAEGWGAFTLPEASSGANPIYSGGGTILESSGSSWNETTHEQWSRSMGATAWQAQTGGGSGVGQGVTSGALTAWGTYVRAMGSASLNGMWEQHANQVGQTDWDRNYQLGTDGRWRESGTWNQADSASGFWRNSGSGYYTMPPSSVPGLQTFGGGSFAEFQDQLWETDQSISKALDASGNWTVTDGQIDRANTASGWTQYAGDGGYTYASSNFTMAGAWSESARDTQSETTRLSEIWSGSGWTAVAGQYDQLASGFTNQLYSGLGTVILEADPNAITRYTGSVQTFEQGGAATRYNQQQHWGLGTDGSWSPSSGQAHQSASTWDKTFSTGSGAYTYQSGNTTLVGAWLQQASTDARTWAETHATLLTNGSWTENNTYQQVDFSAQDDAWSGTGTQLYLPDMSASTRYAGTRSITESGKRHWAEQRSQEWAKSGTAAWVAISGEGTGSGSGSDAVHYNGAGTYETDGSNGTGSFSGTWTEAGSSNRTNDERYRYAMDASGNWSTSQGFWDQTASAQSAWSWSGQGSFDFTPDASNVTEYTGTRTTWESGDQNWAEAKQEHWSLAADGTTWLVLLGTGWGSGSSFDATRYVGNGEYGSTSASNSASYTIMHGTWNESGSQRTDRDSQYQYVLASTGDWSTASAVWNEHGQSQSTWQWAGSGRFEYEPNLSATTQYYGERRIAESGRRNWQETTDATWNWSGSAWVVATGVGTGTGSGFDSISFNGDGTYATPSALVTLSGSGGISGSSVRVESSGTWWENGDQRSRYETAYQFALNASGDWTTPHADKSLWEQSNSAWGWNGTGSMSAVSSSVIYVVASGSNVTIPPIFEGSTSWSESGSRSWADQYESEYERGPTDTTWRAVRGSGTGVSDRKTDSSFNGTGTYSWTNAGTPVTGTWADSGGAYSSIHIDRTYTLRVDASNSGSSSSSTSAFWDTEATSTDLFRNRGGFTYTGTGSRSWDWSTSGSASGTASGSTSFTAASLTYTGTLTYSETDRRDWQDEFVEHWAVAYGVDAEWEQVSGIGTGTASGSGRRTTTAAGAFYGSDASGNTITGAWDASAKYQDDFEAVTHHTWVPASGSTSSRYVGTGERTAHDEQFNQFTHHLSASYSYQSGSTSSEWYSGGGQTHMSARESFEQKLLLNYQLDASGTWALSQASGSATSEARTQDDYTGHGTYGWMDASGNNRTGSWTESGIDVNTVRITSTLGLNASGEIDVLDRRKTEIASGGSTWGWMGKSQFTYQPASTDAVSYWGSRRTDEWGNDTWTYHLEATYRPDSGSTSSSASGSASGTASGSSDGWTLESYQGTASGQGGTYETYQGSGSYRRMDESNLTIRGTWTEDGESNKDYTEDAVYRINASGVWELDYSEWHASHSGSGNWDRAGQGAYTYGTASASGSGSASATTSNSAPMSGLHYAGGGTVHDAVNYESSLTWDETWNRSGTAAWQLTSGSGSSSSRRESTASFAGSGAYTYRDSTTTLDGLWQESGSTHRLIESQYTDTVVSGAWQTTGSWTQSVEEDSGWDRAGAGTWHTGLTIGYSGSGTLSDAYSTRWQSRTQETWAMNASGSWSVVSGSGTGSNTVDTDNEFAGGGTYTGTWNGFPLTGTWDTTQQDHSHDVSLLAWTLGSSGSWTTTGTGRTTWDGSSSASQAGSAAGSLSGSDGWGFQWSGNAAYSDNMSMSGSYSAVLDWTYANSTWTPTSGTGQNVQTGQWSGGYTANGTYQRPFESGTLAGTWSQLGSESGSWSQATTLRHTGGTASWETSTHLDASAQGSEQFQYTGAGAYYTGSASSWTGYDGTVYNGSSAYHSQGQESGQQSWSYALTGTTDIGWDGVVHGQVTINASGSASQRWDYTASGSTSSDQSNNTSNASSYYRSTSQWMRQVHTGSDTNWSEQYTVTQSGSAVSITGQSSFTRNAWGDAVGSNQASGVSGQWYRTQTAPMSMSMSGSSSGSGSSTGSMSGSSSGSSMGSMSGTASGSSIGSMSGTASGSNMGSMSGSSMGSMSGTTSSSGSTGSTSGSMSGSSMGSMSGSSMSGSTMGSMSGSMSGSNMGSMSGSSMGSMSGTASSSGSSTGSTSGSMSGSSTSTGAWYGTESTWSYASNTQDHYRHDTTWTASYGAVSSGWGSASMTNTSTHVWGAWQGSSNNTTTTTNYGGTSTSSFGWPSSGSYDQWQWNEGFGTGIWIGGSGGYGYTNTTGLQPRIGSIPTGPMGAAGWGYVESSASASGGASGYPASGPSGSGSMSGTASGSGASTQSIGLSGASGSSSTEAAGAGAAGAGVPGPVSPPPPLVDNRRFWERVQDNFYDMVSDGAATKSWELDQRRKAAGIPIANDRPGVIPGAATFAAAQRYSDSVSAWTRDWVTTVSVYAGAFQDGIREGFVTMTNGARTIVTETGEAAVVYGSAVGEGLQDGAVIMTNALTQGPANLLGYEGPLEAQARELVNQNGGLYAWSNGFATFGSTLLYGAGAGVVIQVAFPYMVRVADLIPCGRFKTFLKGGLIGGVVFLTGDGILHTIDTFRTGLQELQEGKFFDGSTKIGGSLAQGAMFGAGAYDFVKLIRNKQLTWEGFKSWFTSCFTGETPILVEGGSKQIEEIKPGDRVLSRSEHDLASPLMYQQVEEVFVRTSSIIELTVSGKTIRTTREHPFWVIGSGWKPVSEMTVGDRLGGLGQESVLVEKIVDTDQWETVYNFRVSEFHTYFVGCEEWCFSVWAHNLNCQELDDLAVKFAKAAQANGGSVPRGVWNRIAGGQNLTSADKSAIRQVILSDQANGGTRFPKVNIKPRGVTKYGPLGKPSTQALDTEIAGYLKGKRFTLENGLGSGNKQEWIKGPKLGRKGGTAVDLTASRVVDGEIQRVRIQTISTLVDGTTGTPKELAAAARIRAAFPKDRLILVPKEAPRSVWETILASL